MIDLAYAAEAAQAPPQSPLASFFPLILIFAVFYFLLIRPQRKQMQEHTKMISALKKSDRIVTSGGIHGKVTGLQGKQLEVEIASGVRVMVNRTAVSQLHVEEVEIVDTKETK